MWLDRHALANHLEVRWLIIENVSCLRQVGQLGTCVCNARDGQHVVGNNLANEVGYSGFVSLRGNRLR
jgi:hypothetical protein